MNQPEPGFGDFVQPLKDAAISMHEIFLAFVQAGFTENQAIRLIGEMLRNAFTQKTEGPE